MREKDQYPLRGPKISEVILHKMVRIDDDNEKASTSLLIGGYPSIICPQT